MPTSLVGRADDIERVEAFVDRVRLGTPGLLVVRGAAGVGKTALVADVVARLGRSFVVLDCRADEFSAGVPFAALRSGVDELRAGGLDGPLDEAAAELAAALDLATPADAGTVAALMRRTLTAWAERSPVLVVVDDLQWADADTVAVLGFLGRQIRGAAVGVVTTIRTGLDVPDDLAALLDHLVAAGGATAVDLGPLTDDQVAELVGDLGTDGPSRDDAGEIARITGGNPFFVVEVMRAWAAARTAPDDDEGAAGLAAIAGTAGEAVLHRVFRLSATVRRVAQFAALRSHVDLADVGLTAAALGLEDDEVVWAFDKMVAADLLVPDRRGYRFAHPLIRQALVDDLGPARRRRVHAAIADHLAERAARGGPLDVVDRARHVRESARPGDPDAVAALRTAGDVVAARAPLNGARWYGDALAVLGHDGPPAGEIHLARARALLLGHRGPDAVEAARAAVSSLPAGRDRDRARAVEVAALYRSARADEALAVFDAVQASGSPTSRLLVERAQLLIALDRLDEATADLAAAARLDAAAAGRAPDGAATIDVSGDLTRVFCAFASGRAMEGRALAASLTDVVPALRPAAAAAVAGAMAAAFANNGDPAEASRWLDQVGVHGDEVDLGAGTGSAVQARANLWFQLGRWDDAAALVERTVAALPRGGEPLFVPLLLATAIDIHAERGDLAAARARWDEVAAVPLWPSIALGRLGLIEMCDGHLDRAADALAQARDHDRAAGRLGGTMPTTLALLCEVEHRAGRPAAARAAAAELADIVVEGSGVRWQLEADLARARVDDDADRAEAVAAGATAVGLGPLALQARQLAASRRGDGDVLVDVYAGYAGLGAAVRQREVSQRLRELGRSVPKRPRHGDLTDVERRLAHLVAAGHTNREIASIVHLAPKTVENYLSKMFARLGVSSRVELAVAVNTGRIT